jgi:hypothetical protein
MPSPFPGMNPYLEQEDAWHDFHDRFIPLMAEYLNAQVGNKYIVKIDEHVYVHDVGEEQRTFLGRADLAVAGLHDSNSVSSAVGVLEAPVEVEVPRLDVERECFLEIRDRRSRQLITVLELLSPANKSRGNNREQYLGKRDQIMATHVHLVEIDLLRGRPRMPFVDLPPCDYYAMVSRVERRPKAQLWPIRLRDRLPVIPVPLRAPDPDLRLDLQELLHRVYDAAGYVKYIYDSEPVPPLASEDAAWARALVPVHE